MSAEPASRFQVDLRGMIELLSEHLYSGPSVFVRELLQNAVDAITARRALQPEHVGSIEVELAGGPGAPVLTVVDNGVGLDEGEIEQFLATIGGSSKRGLFDRPADFLGRFGIGLLSCFLVADEIVVLTRSARSDDAPGLEWRGRADGTYTVRRLGGEISVGTQVFLTAKPGSTGLFTPGRVEGLLRHYGEFLGESLGTPIVFKAGGEARSINAAFPWTAGGTFEDRTFEDGAALLAFGRRLFETEFLEAIPLRSEAGRALGVAFVLPAEVPAAARPSHRVYLKGMLVSEKVDDLLPEWAFFTRCVVNAEALRPTASREAFYGDDRFDQTREELGGAIRRHLVRLKRSDPRRLAELVRVHSLAIRALCTSDDECLDLFAELLPFETTLGVMPLGEFVREHPHVRYVASVDQFRQLAPVTTAESIPLLNAGYVYDETILSRFARLREGVTVEAFDAAQLADRLETLTLDERERSHALLAVANLVLAEYECEAEVVKFQPAELPALYVEGANSELLRLMDAGREGADPLFDGMLGNLARSMTDGGARLQLNFRNPLVRRVARLADRRGQTYCVEMLYVQALLMARVPLRRKETNLLNGSLLGMIEWSLDLRTEDGDE